jgi:4-hydroxy-tetrahydrodipicolinate synthase
MHPDFRLFAGTGTPSLEETILLTKTAFDLGFTGTVVLPPYYYHQASEEGLIYWYQELIKRAVPADGYLLAYHFPAQSRVPVPLGVLSCLREKYPAQFLGIKDSTGNAEYAFQIGETLDREILILVGNDTLLLDSLHAGASGCITAMGNLHSPVLREIWNSFHRGKPKHKAQEYINLQRKMLDQFRPFPATIKSLLAELHGFPRWALRPPLIPMPVENFTELLQVMRLEFGEIGE